jgi:2-polyprenyl-3-methyl-5-hydroxy-6-metoxy-1,4-benzoquinol methylase
LIIKPENTAITTGVAKSALELEKRCRVVDKILDYGAGKLRNSKYLLSKGYNVSILDTKLQIEKQKQSDLELFGKIYTTEEFPAIEMYDAILCSFVINVIAEPFERVKVLNKAYELLKDNGLLFLEIRKGNGISQNKYNVPYSDGFLVGKNEIKTFQKPFNKNDIFLLFKNTKFAIIELKTCSDSLILIAQKLMEVNENEYGKIRVN